MKKLFFICAALLALATSPAVARSLSVGCDGTIQTHTLSAYTAITNNDGKNVCIFVTGSPEGKIILKACPMGSACSVEGAANNTGDDNEIYKVESVHRTGTPALDAQAKAEKEAERNRKRASLRPYAEVTTNCVMKHSTEVSQDALADALDKFCRQQRDALVGAYFKFYGPGGRYLYNDEYYSQLSNLVKDRAPAAVTPDKVAGCFTRTYDRTHLAKHPDQIVTAVKLHLKKSRNGPSYPYDFVLAFNVRGKNKTLRTEGICREDAVGTAKGVKCRVECDGGGVNVVHRTSDLMMYLDKIRVATCGDNVVEGGDVLYGGKDDREFRLDRVRDVMCAQMVP
jgi:hypothetical protein